MQEIETYTEVVTKTRVIRTTCDKCAKTIVGSEPEGDFEHEWGFRCADGGNGDGIKIANLCHECTLEAFRLLESAGYRVERYKWDY